MAAAMTYDSLLTDVQTWADRDDDPFVSYIPRFLMLAENRLATEVRGLGFQRYVTGALSGNTLEKPARWRETISFNVTDSGVRTYLKLRSYDYCRMYTPNPSTTGLPVYYADYDYEHFFLAPTPDQQYAFELAYFERPQPLDASNQTNWTTQYAPQLILFGTLLEAQGFLKRLDLVPLWQQNYAQAVQQVTQESVRRIQDRATARNSE